MSSELSMKTDLIGSYITLWCYIGDYNGVYTDAQKEYVEAVGKLADWYREQGGDVRIIETNEEYESILENV